MKTKDCVIPVTNLMLDSENPRHDILSGQREIIDWMMKNYEKKIANLAVDIAEKGLSPIERFLVKRIGERYVVLEGNRRLTALKILLAPELCNDATLKSKLERIKETNSIPTTVQAVELLDDTDSEWVIERRHSGEKDGIGLVKWDPFQKARHDERTKGKSRYSNAVALVDFYEKNTKQKVSDKISLTTLQRMLGPEGRNFFGIDIIDNKLHAVISPDEVLKAVKAVMFDLVNELPVSDVYDEVAQKEYFAKHKKKNKYDYTPIETPVQLASAKTEGKKALKNERKQPPKQRR